MKVGINSVDFKSYQPRVKNQKNYATNSVSFTGNNAKQVMHIVPEGAITKGGGVGTVINDWVKKLSGFDPSMEHYFFIPYYNADTYTDDKGKLQVGPIKTKNNGGGTYFVDSVTDIDVPGANVKKYKLQHVVDDTMPFFDKKAGTTVSKKVSLFQVDSAELELPENVKVFTTLSEGTGTMPKVYGYSYKDGSTYFHYSENAKATVKLAEKLKEQTNGAFDPQNVMVHDYHGSAAFKYMQDEALSGQDLYKQIRGGYVIHNGGRAYQGLGGTPFETFTALAKPEQIKKVMDSKEYAKAASAYQFDGGKSMADLMKTIMPDLVDEYGEINPSLVPLKFATKENNIPNGVKQIVTVSPGYHDELLKLPEMSAGITNAMRKVEGQGRFMGIFNGLTPPDVTDQISSQLYSQKPTIKTADGLKDIVLKYADGTSISPLKTFDPANVTADNIQDVIKIKKENAANFVERIVKYKDAVKPDVVSEQVWNPSSIITGNIEKSAKIISNMDANTIELMKKPDAKLFTSWGRGDFQKGIDELLLGIKKYAEQNPNDKSSVFVACGSLGSDAESTRISKIIKELIEDKNLKGRFAYVDGWGAADAFALSSDTSIFTSRYEPCGLTPQEAHARGAKTVATKTGGMATSTRDGIDGFLTKTSFTEITPDEVLKSKYSESFKKEIKKIEDAEKAAVEKQNLIRRRQGLPDIVLSNEQLAKKVEKNQDFSNALRNYRDEILSDDIAATIKKAVDVTPEQSSKMTLAAITAKVDWTNNSAINDGTRSAFESYREFCYQGDIPDLANSRKFIKDDVINKLEPVQKVVDNAKSGNKKLKIIAPVAITVLAAVAATGIYLKNKNAGNAQSKKTMNA